VANCSYRLTSQELFGTYSRTCGSILPCCLGALSQRLAAAYSVGELIRCFTLLPLYQPFLDDATYSAACIAMAGNHGNGLKMSLGLTASRFLKHASFRYCGSCVHEDTQNYGVAYWHRIHQAIGTCICPHHGEVLRAMAFPGRTDWRCMLLPAEADGTPVMESPSGTAASTIAEMQLWGFGHPSDVKTLLAGNFLKHRLDEMGFLKSGRIREQRLRAFLSPRLLESPRVNEFQEIAYSSDWALRILRPRRTVVQPLKFYFFCWLLDVNLEQLKCFHPKKDIRSGDLSFEKDTSNAADEIDIEARRSAFSSSSYLKCHDKPGYHWLHRHDREWLTQYVASHPFIRLRECLIDWKARDLAVARELLAANDLILSVEGKPQKITRAALDRRVACGHEFLRTPDNFPISIRRMNDLLESNHDYQVRKIKWAARHYLLSERCAVSVIYRFAGIRVSHVTEAEVFKLLSCMK
ncbi:hypothetical protein DQ405_026755, partial [Pseudomonas sp. SST3]|nr:hypothetical protein [Pseudomonas sp. SST3]